MRPIIEEINLNRTPFQVYSYLHSMPESAFLDSGMDPGKLGRYSFIGIEPFMEFTSKSKRVRVNSEGWKKEFYGNPFNVLQDLLNRHRSDFRTGLFPFWGGAIGWFSYDLKDFFEDLPDLSKDDIGMPDCELRFYDVVLAFDNLKNKAYICSSGLPEHGKRKSLRARARLDSVKCRLENILDNDKPLYMAEESDPLPDDCGLTSNVSRDDYKKAVLKAKDHIEAGEIYQVNLSRRFSAETGQRPFRIYSALRRINPAPFAAYLNYGDIKIISASPERYIRVSGEGIQTRPIKGTRPRGKNKTEDRKLRENLKNSIKDRAENLMIVDLERNDLGRVCVYGTVRVTEFMICEEFPTVFHLTSTVEGRLRPGIDTRAIFKNCFPGGSITGAPKIRSMEIIEELEPVKRAVYTGAVGYIGFNGDMDTSVVIRTLIHKNKKLYFNVGGGIVYDSVPEKEYEETIHKASAMIRVLTDSTGVVNGAKK